MPELRIRERHDITTSERAALMLGVSSVTVRNWILLGRLGAERIAGRYFVDRIEIEALAKQRLERATAAAE